jgi:aminoglycoside phosphotransferase family enzyme/predicted kinase
MAAALARPSSHPRDPSAGRALRVAWIQTHLSHVYLTPTRVYKLRKAVDLGFVDFSTRARRNADCRDELHLNRRLAPDVYLGVAPVEGRGARLRVGRLDHDGRTAAAREHVVVMRRLPAGRDALSLLERGALQRAHVEAVAERLAAFHAEHGLGRPSPWSRRAWLARVQAPVHENLRLLQPGAGRLFPRASFEAVREAARGFAARHRGAFEARRREGRAVDGHGDVHLQHVWFESGRSDPILVDCIEFNPNLRRIDAAAEVAFLAMDLVYRRRPRLAAHFLAHYAAVADDYGLYSVVDYFVSYRAAVRAKVAQIAADDAGIAAAQRAAAKASTRRHVALAARALRARAPGAVVLITGVVGTGKSTAAAVAADALEGVVIASDRVRRARGAAPAYTQAAKDRIYAGLLARAEPVVRSGRVAVLDATYERAVHRRAVFRWARAQGVRVWVVETRVRREVALARLARRQARGRSLSDAGPERHAKSLRAFAPVRVPAGVAHAVVHTDRAGWRAELRRRARVWRS